MKINRSIIQTITFLASVLTFTFVASAQTIRYNFVPGTNFSQYHTYKWQRVENADYPNQILDGQITSSIDAQLASKGLRKTDTDPDLIVVYQVAVNHEKQWNAYSTGGGWGYGGWGGWGGMGGMTTTTSSTISIGTLNLDFYDLKTKKQVWRGEATKTLDPPKDPNKLQKNIDKAVAKLLKNFPPPAGK